MRVATLSELNGWRGVTAFAGVGMHDMGVSRYLKAMTAVEFDPKIAAAHQIAHPSSEVLAKDIRDVDFTPYRGAFAFHASPVCKNFSLAKPKAARTANLSLPDDKNIDLMTAEATSRGICQIQPTVFTLENVRGYIDTSVLDRLNAVGRRDGDASEEELESVLSDMKKATDATGREFDPYRPIKGILRTLHEEGYRFDLGVYNSRQYGVPQDRARLLLRAWNLSEPLPPQPPLDSRSQDGTRYVGWKEALDGIPNALTDIDHRGNPIRMSPGYLARFEGKPKTIAELTKILFARHPDADALFISGKTYPDKEPTVRTPDQPIPTMVTTGRDYVLTKEGYLSIAHVGALKRWGGVPDEVRMPEVRTMAKKVIGNGVPPPLSAGVFGPMLKRAAEIKRERTTAAPAIQGSKGGSMTGAGGGGSGKPPVPPKKTTGPEPEGELPEKWKRVVDGIIDAANIPKTLNAAGDLSAGARHGWLLGGPMGILYPKQSWTAFGKQLQSIVSKARYEDILREISSFPEAKSGLMDKAGLFMSTRDEWPEPEVAEGTPGHLQSQLRRAMERATPKPADMQGAGPQYPPPFTPTGPKPPVMAPSETPNPPYVKRALRRTGERDESFMSEYARHLPHVAASERGYFVMQDYLRAGVFHTWSDQLRAMGIDPETNIKPYKDLASLINILTGRGKLAVGGYRMSIGGRTVIVPEKKLPSEIAGVLNATLFSPRYWASRFQALNPATYIGMAPGARKVAVTHALKFLASLGGLALLTKLAGGEMGIDPDDPSTFLRAKFGNVGYDISNNISGHLRFLYRFSRSLVHHLKGEKDESDSENGGKLIAEYVHGKEAPPTRFVHGMITGRDLGGRPFSPWASLASQFLPMLTGDLIGYFAENGWEGFDNFWKENTSPEAVQKGLGDFLGIGVQVDNGPKGGPAKRNPLLPKPPSLRPPPLPKLPRPGVGMNASPVKTLPGLVSAQRRRV